MVTPRYLPEMGGVERHVHEVATRLAAGSAGGGADVRVLTTDRDGTLPEHDRDLAVDVRRVRARPAGRDWRFAPGLRAAMREGEWDIVHVQSYHTAVAPQAMRGARRLGLPYVVTFHGGGHSDALRHRSRPLQRRVLAPLLRGADRLVAVASFEVEQYGSELGIPPERFALIPNGVDLPELPADQRPAPPDPAAPLVASVGRLEAYKGHRRVIEAFPLVLEQIPGARLWIAGTGPDEAHLRELAAGAGIGDRVDIRAVPASDRLAMARELSKTSLVTLLSEFETHPIAALEALSLGRPLLVGEGSGIGEISSRGLARAVAADASADEVARAIVRELRDPLIPDHPDLPTWDDCAAALRALYDDVIAARAACAS
jgi:glycosyltransferase involved in cell wall biosynthesis